MKTQALLTFFILLFAINSKAEEVGESRDLQPFREVSLRLSANLFIEQGVFKKNLSFPAFGLAAFSR